MKLLAFGHSARLIVIALMLGVIVTTANANTPPKTPATAKKVQAVALTKADILEAEQLLAGLGYWTGPVDGRFDAASRHALVAFQKVEGRQRSGRLTVAELQALRTAARPTPLETGYAHVEADLNRQVLFVVDDSGAVTRVLPISSGSGEEFTSEGWTRNAVTPTGRFKVYRKVDGWRKAPLGSIYYPNYFLSGVAIHGSASIPTKPASHGCIRIPVYAAKEFSQITPTGTVVLVYDASTMAQIKHSATKAQ
jgi:lipoprotein-anchoring transpeptidase ErfK/SrfK